MSHHRSPLSPEEERRLITTVEADSEITIGEIQRRFNLTGPEAWRVLEKHGFKRQGRKLIRSNFMDKKETAIRLVSLEFLGKCKCGGAFQQMADDDRIVCEDCGEPYQSPRVEDLIQRTEEMIRVWKSFAATMHKAIEAISQLVAAIPPELVKPNQKYYAWCQHGPTCPDVGMGPNCRRQL